jgi:hypothetical protein
MGLSASLRDVEMETGAGRRNRDLAVGSDRRRRQFEIVQPVQDLGGRDGRSSRALDRSAAGWDVFGQLSLTSMASGSHPGHLDPGVALLDHARLSRLALVSRLRCLDAVPVAPISREVAAADGVKLRETGDTRDGVVGTEEADAGAFLRRTSTPNSIRGAFAGRFQNANIIATRRSTARPRTTAFLSLRESLLYS